MQRLTAHQRTVNNKQRNNRMHLERASLEPQSTRHLVQDPSLGDPPCHERVEAQRRGDGRTLEVRRLAGRILGDDAAGRRHIEPRQPREPAEHKDGEQYVVKGCAHADGEGDAGRG